MLSEEITTSDASYQYMNAAGEIKYNMTNDYMWICEKLENTDIYRVIQEHS